MFKCLGRLTLFSTVMIACEQLEHQQSFNPQGRIQQAGYKTDTSSRLKSMPYQKVKPLEVDGKKVQSHQGLTQVRAKRKNKGLATKIEVEKLIVAKAVKKRRAIGESRQFTAHIGAVWSLAQVYAQGGTAELQMRWWKEDNLVSVSPFMVAEGLRWREWSKVTIQPHESGAWRVEVYQPQTKKVLSTHDFSIKARSERKSELIPIEVNKKQKSAKLSSIRSTATLLKQSKAKLGDSDSSLDGMGLLEIKNLMIANKIKRRKPLGVSSRFSLNNERLWGYVEVSNLERPQFIWMEWYHGDTLRSRLKVRVGVSKRWRTWSWQRLSKLDEGAWSVKVLSLQGEPLAQTQFVVVP